MKTNKTLIYVVAALLSGLLLGYFFFNKDSESHEHESTVAGSQEEVWTCSMHPQIGQLPGSGCLI